ncbi:MAG: DUF3084 domain-containing protein [Candidatus Xenobia bacterium]
MQGIWLIALGGFLSGGIAILGNQVGRFVGRRKLSIFHVRPRYTSYVVTFTTGLLIFVAAVLVLLALSRPVNQMLLHMDELQTKYGALQQQTAEQQQELEKAKQRLVDISGELRDSNPVFKGDDIVYMGLINCSVSPSDIESQLDAVLQAGNQFVVKLHNSRVKDSPVPDDTRMLGYARQDADSKSKIVEQLSHLHGNHVVVLRALWNIYDRDRVVPVNIEVWPFVEAFSKNEVIASLRFTGKEPRGAVLPDMQKFLHEDVQKVLQAHRMVTPSRQTRVPVEFPLQMVVDAHHEIVAAHHPVTLQVIANRNLSNMDSLDARLVVSP